MFFTGVNFYILERDGKSKERKKKRDLSIRTSEKEASFLIFGAFF